MKLNNIKDLKSKKGELKAEIEEMESILSFENPRKTFGVMTEGVSEKYLGNILNSNLTEKVLPVAGALLGGSLKLGSAKLINNVVKKHLTKTLLTKGAIGLGVLIVAPFLIKKIKNKVNDYQKKETAKSLSKLI